jgi:DNA-damage-inducible protein D
MPSTHLALFQGRQVRKVLHDGVWFFVVQDVVAVLTDSADPRQYIKKLRSRDPQLNEGWVQLVPPLSVPTTGGVQKLGCANTQGLFRIIQSVPSPKAEPFKAWLAQVGAERIQEIEDPELASRRARELYKAKGYPEDWIEKRMRAIAIREELTGEWKDRGIQEQKDFAILTAEISRATFGVTPSQHKSIKGLERENLRDHMNDLELIFSMLGEAATTEITRAKDARGFGQNKDAAKEGGSVAGQARKELEQKSGRKVVTPQNFLPEKKARRIMKKD